MFARPGAGQLWGGGEDSGCGALSGEGPPAALRRPRLCWPSRDRNIPQEREEEAEGTGAAVGATVPVCLSVGTGSAPFNPFDLGFLGAGLLFGDRHGNGMV